MLISLNLQRSTGIRLERCPKRQVLTSKNVTSPAAQQKQELERDRKAKRLAIYARFFHPQLERLHDDRGDFGAATVDLAVLAAVFAIGIRRRLVPLALGDDVADLVVGQADQQPLGARHQ